MAMNSSVKLFLSGEEDDFGFEFFPVDYEDLALSQWELVDPSDVDCPDSDRYEDPDTVPGPAPAVHEALPDPAAAGSSFSGGDDGQLAARAGNPASALDPVVLSSAEFCEQQGWIHRSLDGTVVPFAASRSFSRSDNGLWVDSAGNPASELDQIMLAAAEYCAQQARVHGGGIRGLARDDYEEEEDDEDDEDDGLDDELVPRHLRGKLGRQRMRKLGKRACSKMNTSKRSPHLYVKPGCVYGKHGLGLKHSLC